MIASQTSKQQSFCPEIEAFWQCYWFTQELDGFKQGSGVQHSISLSQCWYHLCCFAAGIKAPAQKLFLTGILQDPAMFSDFLFLGKTELLPIRSGRGEGRGEEYLRLYNGDCMWSQVTLHFCPEATHVLVVLNPLKTCVSKHLSFRNTLWNTIFSCWAFYLFTADRQKRVKIVLGSLVVFGDTA